MSVICLEGASGIGKTTASQFLVEEYGYVRVPEVNELFDRSNSETPTWYFEKQIERWEIAKRISEKGKVAILDGDHFQPLWYNWIFTDLGFQPVSEVMQFYKSAIMESKISFPDLYILLSLSESQLRLRKEGDRKRSRKNFEIHLRLIQPQRHYFKKLNQMTNGIVKFIKSTSVEEVAREITTLMNTRKKPSFDNLRVFNAIEKFIDLSNNKVRSKGGKLSFL